MSYAKKKKGERTELDGKANYLLLQLLGEGRVNLGEQVIGNIHGGEQRLFFLNWHVILIFRFHVISAAI
jgi:hypothetical protein